MFRSDVVLSYLEDLTIYIIGKGKALLADEALNNSDSDA